MSDFISRIKKGFWEKEQQVVQRCKDEQRRKAAKLNTPAVTMSGVYVGKREGEPDEHNSYICIDVDGKDNPDIMDKRKLLQKDPFVFGYFKSISGNGLAILFRIKPTKHLEGFNGIQKYLLDKYNIVVDRACKDPGRLRFVSYDPEIYWKASKQVFNKPLEQYIPERKMEKNINEDEVKDLVARIVKKRKDIVPDYNSWYIVGQALAILGEKGRKYFHEVSQFGKTYSKRDADRQFDSCLSQEEKGGRDKKVGLGSLFFFAKEAGIHIDTPKISSRKDHLVEVHKEYVDLVEDGILEKSGLYRYHIWEFKVKKNKNDYTLECVGASTEGISEFLFNMGVRVDRGKKYFKLVGKLVERLEFEEVLDYIVKETKKLSNSFAICYDNSNFIHKDQIKPAVQNTAKVKIERNLMLQNFNPERVKWIQDTKDTAYIFFQNGIVEINRKGWELREYTDIEGYVWKDSIIEREFKMVKTKSIVQDILCNAIGKENWDCVQSAIGYMVHNHTDEEGNRILFCIDKNIGELNEGGNGKDFFRQVVNGVRRTVVIPAKNLNMHNQFAFERLNPDTQIMWLEDLGRHIKVENLYNMNEGVVVRKMHTNPFKLKCKIGISLQHLIDMEGSSDERRQLFLLFKDFYSKAGGIGKYHKQRAIIGKDWEGDWNAYYSMMVNAVQYYFKNGIKFMDIEELKEARLDSLSVNGDFDNLELGKWYSTEDAIRFVWGEDTDIDISTFKKFRKDMASWAKLKGLELEAERRKVKGRLVRSIRLVKYGYTSTMKIVK